MIWTLQVVKNSMKHSCGK